MLYMAGLAIYIRRGVFVARSSVRASSKASVMELATMKVPRFLFDDQHLCCLVVFKFNACWEPKAKLKTD